MYISLGLSVLLNKRRIFKFVRLFLNGTEKRIFFQKIKRANHFFQHLVNILPFKYGSVNPHIFADPGPGSKMLRIERILIPSTAFPDENILNFVGYDRGCHPNSGSLFKVSRDC